MRWIWRSAYGLLLLTWLALIALWIHSYWFLTSYGVSSRKQFPVHLIMSVRGGIFIWYYYPPLPPTARYEFRHASFSRVPGLNSAPSGELAFYWSPQGLFGGANQATIAFPHWAPAAALLPAVAIPPFRRWRRRRLRPGTCRNCGYDLTGNVSGVCPECGAAFAAELPTL